MPSYDESDAWKACHELVLTMYRATKPMEERDPGLTHRLRYATLRAAGRLAFGSGTGNKRMYLTAAGHTLSYLAETGYLLNLVRTLELLPENACAMLDALRGRATFYTEKLLDSILQGPAPPTEQSRE